MMRLIFQLLFVIQGCPVLGQNQIDFIKSYHEHIDPGHSLDTLNYLTVTYKLKANGTLHAHGFHINDTNTCEYFADGRQKCIHGETGGSIDAFMPPVKIEFDNALKNLLNFISVQGDSVALLFKAVNDSVTVLEKRVNSRQKYTYTFDSKALDLLQLENSFTAGNNTFHSVTRFEGYQRVDGILLPKNTIVTFSIINSFTKDFCEATLEYANVSFK